MDKKITLENDVVVSYWRVQNVNMDFDKDRAIASFVGYVTEDTFLKDPGLKVLERSLEISMAVLSEKLGVKTFVENEILNLLEQEANAKKP